MTLTTKSYNTFQLDLFIVCKIETTKLEKSIFKRLPPVFKFMVTWDTFEKVGAEK